MRVAIHADIEVTVESREEVSLLMLGLADDPCVLSLDYTTTERVFVPVRDESVADFGL